MVEKFNRRKFLRSSAMISSAAISASGLSLASCTTKKDENKEFTYVDPPAGNQLLQTLENEILKVDIFSDARLRILDKINDQLWDTFSTAIQDETIIRESMLWGRGARGMGEQYPGRFIGEKEGSAFRFKLYDRQKILTGSFSCSFSLNAEWLSLEIQEIDDNVPSLVFPPAFKHEATVLPTDGGKLIRNNSDSIYSGIYSREYLQFFNALGMRFISGLKGDNGWICAFDTRTADAGAMMVNGHITPAWVRSMGKWNSRYRVHYSFTGNGYVGLAKRYRQFAIDNGFFVSLKEKVEKNPEALKLLGGRALQFMQLRAKGYDSTQDDYWATDRQTSDFERDNLNFTFKDILNKVRLAEDRLKFNKGMVLLRGWMHGGYDSSHPDIWPLEKSLGTENEFQQVLDLRDKYLTVLHDNYQDFYPTTESFPDGVIVRKNGKLMAGGLWFGKQCYLTHSGKGIEYAKRNWEQIKKFRPSGYFVDCVPCNPLHESYEEGNEQTRLDDMDNKFGILKVFNDQNLVTGSERFGDFCIPVLHWIEHSQKRKQGETIPMWQLVFHDAAFACRYDVFDPTTPYPSWIEDMFYGNFLRFWMPNNFGEGGKYDCGYHGGWGNWHFTEEEFLNTYHVDEWHAKIGMEEMTSHRFLTEDMKVEEVVYGDRYKMIVNFDDKPRMVNGRLFKAYEYITEG